MVNGLDKDHPLVWNLSFDETLLESVAKERVLFLNFVRLIVDIQSRTLPKSKKLPNESFEMTNRYEITDNQRLKKNRTKSFST